MKSKILTPHEGQGELPLTRVITPIDLPLEVILRRRTLLGAIKLMVEVSGLELKEAYQPLKIDAGHWSRMMNGDNANFPTDERFELAMDVCGNEIPLIWLAHRRGKGLHMLETEAERQLREERSRRVIAETKLQALQEAIAGRFGPSS